MTHDKTAQDKRALHEPTIHAALEGMRSGEFTSVQLTQALLIASPRSTAMSRPICA